MTDIDLLSVFRRPNASHLITAEAAAEWLSTTVEDARVRLDRLVGGGYLAGPILVAWAGSEEGYTDVGYGLLAKGTSAIDDFHD